MPPRPGTGWLDQRVAAVLLPLFSLRSDRGWGVGEIPDLAAFARWAHAVGLGAVQLLPVHEIARTESSPYSALSAFALDPVYLSLDACEDFAAAGGTAALDDEDCAWIETARRAPRVAWEAVRAVKARAFDLAFARFEARETATASRRARAFDAFREARRDWLDDYALSWALAERWGHNWRAWPEALRARAPETLAQARDELAPRIRYRAWLEWHLDAQWTATRAAAADTGVELWGDLPFVVSPDAADVWSRQGDFRLDLRAGAPPDAFTAHGQDWGLPVYDWPAVAASNHTWMRARARRAGELYSCYRVDHVVGLYRTYHFRNDGGPSGFLPPDEPDQLANGESVLRLLDEGCRVIAEDLGVIPPFVRASLARLGIPGYRVQRWEKDDHVFRDPATWPALSVATTGTHDTETLAEWYEALPQHERDALFVIPGLRARVPAGASEPRLTPEIRDALLALLVESPSAALVIAFQDLFGDRARINVPGTVGPANWTWRMTGSIDDLVADAETNRRLHALLLARARPARY